MKKAQYLLVVGGVLLTSVLAFMPKAVVDGKRSVAQKTEKTDEKAQEADSHGVHGEEISGEQLELISGLRQRFFLAEQKADLLPLFDSLNSIYRQFNRYDSAAILSQTVVQHFPEDIDAVNRAASAWFDLFGLSLTEESASKAREFALTHLNKLLSLEPGNLDNQVRIGVIKVNSENPMEGITAIRGVLEKDPSNQEAIFQLGMLSARSGQFDKAVSRFRQLLEIAPEREDAAVALAESLLRTGKNEEAKELLQRLKDTTKDPAVRAAAQSLLAGTDG